MNPGMFEQMENGFRCERLARRTFLRNVAAGSAAVLPLVETARRQLRAEEGGALVGSNVYGWTQYAKREGRPFDIVATMATLRECGYDYLECGFDLARPESIGELAGQMRANGLRPVSLYVGPRLHEADKVADVVGQLLAAGRACRASGFRSLTCNPAPIGRAKTEAELKIQAAALGEVGRGLAQIGIGLGIHHHLPELADGAREFHHVFRNTDPGAVGFCYDVHWVWKGGVQPADALREYGSRIVSWHLRQSRGGVWWEDLDSGDIDYGAIAREAGARGWPRMFTVELALEPKTAVTRSAAENHRRSREYVRRVFGA